MRAPSLALALALTAACDDNPHDTSRYVDSVESFPAGSSAWTGTADIGGTEWSVAVDLDHEEGRLVGSFTFEPDGADLEFLVDGVVDRETGAVVLVPNTWVGEAPGLEVVGLSGTYDPATGMLEGTVRDVTSWDSNTPLGGAVSLSTTSAPAEVVLSDIAIDDLPDQTSFTGTFKCLGDTRPLSGSLSRGADDLFTGEISWEDTDGSDLGTFAVEGLESEGWLSIVPLYWVEEDSPDTNYANNYMDGSLAGTVFTGTLSQNIAADCEAGGVQISFE